MRGYPGESPPKEVPRPLTPLPTGDTTNDDTPEPIRTSSRVDSSRVPRQCSLDTRPWARRRRAADRCEPLGDSGNIRDPWVPWRPEKLSEKQIAAAAAAAAHLLDAGYPPVFDIGTLRAMWKAGHHQLVDDLRGGAR